MRHAHNRQEIVEQFTGEAFNSLRFIGVRKASEHRDRVRWALMAIADLNAGIVKPADEACYISEVADRLADAHTDRDSPGDEAWSQMYDRIEAALKVMVERMKGAL